ncbi:hypothetical protein AB0M91_03220 [Micromonospora rifamycinica]|uniref:T3SS (YopN, CesT) and YbjN peptide-binding chaperone 1 n=1 Tax=Micromonospora rifamycinica TaxID=291594 RepID=UPI00340109F7
MNRTDGKAIAALFEQIGWTCEVVDEHTVVTGYRCPVPGYHYPLLIEVKATPHWVYLRALLQREVSFAARGPVLRLISELNVHSRQAKFLLVQGCVVIQAEVPAVQWHPGVFQDMLQTVCRLGTYSGVEISVLATDLTVGVLFEAVQRRAEEADAHTLLGQPEQELDFDISVNRIQDWSQPSEGDA